jgi:hypothetical protein
MLLGSMVTQSDNVMLSTDLPRDANVDVAADLVEPS